MADTVQAPNQLQTLQGLINLLGGGGNTVTTNAGDTAQLEALLAALQGEDYAATLNSVFNKATQQIPQLQIALGNALGARSGSNSSVAVALQNLLKQTALEGQSQIVNQQLDNQKIQANAAGNVAQATKGTTQKTSNNSNLGQLAAILGLAQAGVQLTGSTNVTDMLNKFIGGGAGQAQGAQVQPAQPAQNFTPMPAQQQGYNVNTALSTPAQSYAPAQVMEAAPVFNTPSQDFTLAPWYQEPFSLDMWNTGFGGNQDFTPAPWYQEPTDVMSYFGS